MRSDIVQAWHKAREEYQLRYAKFYKKYKENPENKENLGHLLEASWVLIGVFGLTDAQVEEVEKNYGLTDEELLDGRN